MRLWRATTVTAAIFLECAGASNAKSELKTVGDLAKNCIADDRSICVKFIMDLIEVLEDDRRTRGEPSCLIDQQSREQTVKIFVHELLVKYTYTDLSPSAAVENIYNENCGRAN